MYERQELVDRKGDPEEGGQRGAKNRVRVEREEVPVNALRTVA